MAELPITTRAEVVLPDPDPAAAAALEVAVANPGDREALGQVIRKDPSLPAAWAALSDVGRDPVERYAAARVGYHRGLDALRRHGWGGTGYVRWRHPSNRGFLTCLARLREAAREIGETAEVERVDAFLRDLDPDWDDAWVA